MIEFDVEFDFRKDTICGDPDSDSLKLYENHKILWTKKLPTTQILNLGILKIGGKFQRILLKSNLSENLSSDRMCPHWVGKYKGKFDGWLTESEKEDFEQKVRTIGGHIIFPAHKKEGFTINQARGVDKKICDRFDLTLECIKRFYSGEIETSPLYTVISRYSDFFYLFQTFENYIQFFLLQDFVDEEYNVNFLIPFDNFSRSPLPQTIEEYIIYKYETINLINKRNCRIKEYLSELLKERSVN